MKTREIKFRFWSGDKMFYSFEEVMECLKQQLAYNQNIAGSLKYDHQGEHGGAFMQFTGLLDKNGKEIYEGDICKCHDHPTGIDDTIGEIIFYCGRYWVSTGSICSLDDYGTAWTEVLGNIYEHSDLLK